MSQTYKCQLNDEASVKVIEVDNFIGLEIEHEHGCPIVRIRLSDADAFNLMADLSNKLSE